MAKTIPFGTHDSEEAIQFAGRVLVMSRRPATFQEGVEIDLPRPRDLNSLAYSERRERIFRAMGMSVHGAAITISSSGRRTVSRRERIHEPRVTIVKRKRSTGGGLDRTAFPSFRHHLPGLRVPWRRLPLDGGKHFH